MVQKGKRVASTQYVIRHSDNQYRNAIRTIHIGDIGLEAGEEYLIELYSTKGNQTKDRVASFTSSVSSDGIQVSIPKAVVKENKEITPGKNFKFIFYEIKEANEGDIVDFIDSSAVLDRCEPTNGGSKDSNGLDNRLYSKAVNSYLRSMGGESELIFRNTRTQMEARTVSHSDYEGAGYPIYFPTEVQNEIDAQTSDLIEVIAPPTNTSAQNDELYEKVNEVYEMVSEMYDAYLSNKND